MKFSRIIGILTLVVFAMACSGKLEKNFNSNPEIFKEFISAYTAGPVPAKSDIRVQLAVNMPNWKPNTEVESGYFTITPSVRGKVMSLGNNTLAFVPDKPLENGKEYQVRFHLDKATAVTEGLEEFRFTVKTIRQDATVKILDFQSYDNEFAYVNGQLRTADAITLETAKKMVSAYYTNEDIKIKFDAKNSSPTDFRFIVDSLKRFDSNVTFTLKCNTEIIGQKRIENLDFPIAAKGNFKVMRIVGGGNGSQEVSINFSERLDKNQDFSGLVAIQGAPNLRYTTQGNVLKVFFDTDAAVSKSSVTQLQTATAQDSTAVEAVVEETAASPNSTNELQVRLIEIFSGIKSWDGKRLGENYSQKLDFGQVQPGFRFLKSGVLLPSSSNLKVNFEVANLHSIDVKIYRIYKNNVMQFLQDNQLNGNQNLRRVAQPIAKQTINLKQNQLLDYSKWNAYAVDLSTLIKPDPGSIYRVELSAKKAYSLYNCTENTSDDYEYESEEIDENDVNYSNYGYDYYDDYWYEDEDPCSYYYFQKRVGTNVLASDLGVIVKRGLDKSYMIAVSDLITTKPVSGAKVELYNYQQQLISSGATSNDGLVQFQSDKLAYFALVSKNDQVTYVKLDDNRSLSLSSFDVSGESLEKGIKGYLYGERGVWRPGDSIFMSFALNDKANPLPEMHPVKFRLNDPHGKTVFQTVKPTNSNDHYVFKMATDPSAPTGNWEARVTVGGVNFYKNVKIETIKPNRLKIKNSVQDGFISATKNIPYHLQVNWLHGAAANNLKTEIQLKLQRVVTEFKGYSGYVFDDESRYFSDEEVDIYSGNTSANGEITYHINPKSYLQPQGKLKAAIVTKVHENGGDVSTDVSTADYSPYASYVGIKAPTSSEYGWLSTDVNHTYQLVHLSENGQPKPGSKLNVYIYRLESRWWWDSSSDNISRYSQTQYVKSYKEFGITTSGSGKAQFQLQIPKGDWGRYLIRVEDPNGKHATSTISAFDNGDWTGRSREELGESASVLKFATDKPTYAVGEKAKVSFPSSADSRALISIENGVKVIRAFWVNTKENTTEVEIPITAEMAPNAYVHISLIQPHSNTKNDAPMRLYGVSPILVEDKETRLQPVIAMSSELKPNQKFEVKVSEKSGKAMSYTLAIVDEGLLDLTRFKTPNAWDSFFTRSALGVRTWDVYDEVIGAYGGKINQVFAIGGDESLGGEKNKKANRFPPVVKFLGPFKIKGNATGTHQITLPNYVGSVRVMVVASNNEENAYGNAEKTVAVKSPLMTLASLPRKITPGEKVSLPVTVFAMKPNIKDVEVSVKTSPNLKIVGSPKQLLKFSQPDEKMAYFNLEVSQSTGIGKVDVVVKSGKEIANYQVEIDIYNPNPVTHTYTDLIVGGNKSGSLKYQVFGESGTSKIMLEVSTMPTIDLNRRLDYLIQYPHGCIEQTTSIAFAQLYLPELVDLPSDRSNQVQSYLNNAIKKLGSMQLSSGGLGYWPGQSNEDIWGTNYAGHFLLEAEAKGFSLPSGFKSRWIQYQKREASKWRYDAHYHNDFPQAYRLYTLAMANQPDLASMNRLRETKGISNESKMRLAAAYALLKQKDAAQQLVSSVKLGVYNKDYGYYGSEDRNRAMELETLILLNDTKSAFKVANILAKSLSSNQWMSTQSTAYGLLAMAKFALKNGKGGINIDVVNGKDITAVSSKKSIVSLKISPKSNTPLVLKNKNGNNLFARVLSSGILPVGKELAVSNQLAVRTQFKSRTGETIDIRSLKQGTELIAHITLENTSTESISNVALTQILPSGMEIVNTRFTDYGDLSSNKADYIDIRDDRMNFYFGLRPREKKTFTMILNASYVGKYYLPGVQAEAMYDHSYQARGLGTWMEIVR